MESKFKAKKKKYFILIDYHSCSASAFSPLGVFLHKSKTCQNIIGAALKAIIKCLTIIHFNWWHQAQMIFIELQILREYVFGNKEKRHQ